MTLQIKAVRKGYAVNKKKILVGISCLFVVGGVAAIATTQMDCKKELGGEEGFLSEAVCKKITTVATIFAEISGLFGAFMAAFEIAEKVLGRFRPEELPDQKDLDEKERGLERLSNQLMFEINKMLIERAGYKAQASPSEIIKLIRTLEKCEAEKKAEMKEISEENKGFDPNEFLNSLQEMRNEKEDAAKRDGAELTTTTTASTTTTNVKMIVMLSRLIKRPLTKNNDLNQVAEVTESVINAFKANDKKRKVSAPPRFGKLTMHEEAIIKSSNAKSLKTRKISAPLTKLEMAEIQPLHRILEDPNIVPESDTGV